MSRRDFHPHLRRTNALQKGADRRFNLLRGLIGHQPERQFGKGFARDHRLPPRPLVPAPDAIHLGRGPTPDALHRAISLLAHERVGADRLLEKIVIQRQTRPFRAFPALNLHHGVVEPGNGHAKMFVVQARNKPGQEGGGIWSRAAVDARMQVGLRARELHLHRENAAQAVGERRNAARHHPGIRNGDQIAGEFLLVFLQKTAQTLAAAFLLAFHHKHHVQGEIVGLLQRFLNAEDVRQDLPLVIRSATGVDLPILQRRFKRRRRPLLQRVRRLHIVMAVNKQRASARFALATRHHDRVPVGGIDLRLQPHALEFLFEPPRASCNLRRVLRVRRNAWKTEKLEKLGKKRAVHGA